MLVNECIKSQKEGMTSNQYTEFITVVNINDYCDCIITTTFQESASDLINMSNEQILKIQNNCLIESSK